MARDTTHALSFGGAADDYELGRPGYPDGAVRWIIEQLANGMPGGAAPEAAGRAATFEAGDKPTGRPTFVDVGAGTGKFTASLVDRDSRVVAVEPDAQMRERLAANLPTVTALDGSGESAEEYDTEAPVILPPLQKVAYAEFFWQNPLTRAQVIAMITSRSYIITMTGPERGAVLRQVDELLHDHPQLASSESYVMPYCTRVTLARPIGE